MKAPKKLSIAMRMALEDEAIMVKRKDVVIDMDNYHRPNKGKCHMCFAGVVMHRRHNLDMNEYLLLKYFKNDWKNVFRSLNHVRNGRINSALDYFGLDEDIILDFNVTPYEKDRKQFRKDMFKIVKLLEKKGL